MTLTIGSLCSGYEGIGLGIGGDVVYVCDPEPAAALLLKAHHPDAPNHHDLKALTWAETPVHLLTAGYPCQPFSGAGKRAGTEDSRHLWPWIAQGIARSRPPLVLLENVRGHLSLGWDTVLADLHRLGYDVRWTLIRAADVGAPHGRARLFALAADRDVNRWQPSSRMPVARVKDDVLVHPEDGLFGSHPLPLADNGHVPMWPAGLMVDGVVWEQTPLLGTAQYELLPTPTSADSNGHHMRGGDRAAEMLLPGVAMAHARGELLPTPCANDSGNTPEEHLRKKPGRTTITSLTVLADHGLLSEEALLPTPRTTDANGAGTHGDGGMDLRTAVDLLPTPTARDHKGANQRQDDTCLTGALLPTPRATDGTKGGPNQRGSSGDLMLPSAVMPQNLLSTPLASDAGGGRGSTSGFGLRDDVRALAREESRWGRYAAAIARCEALTRPAPDPTLPSGKGGAQRLSPLFVEWMMMLPEGWVTGHGLKRDAQLKALGNGVVPAQAAAAWRHLKTGLSARGEVAA